jgi:hypothetical protein
MKWRRREMQQKVAFIIKIQIYYNEANYAEVTAILKSSS